MADSAKLEQNKTEASLGSNGRTILISVFGGLIWGFCGWVAFYLNFSQVGPALILQPWALGHWKTGVSGQLLGIVAICVVSIPIGYIYRATLGRLKSMWISIVFGLILWVVVFYILQPWIPHLKPVTRLSKDTIATTICLYVLYGLFVGYSLSFDVYELAKSENYSKK